MLLFTFVGPPTAVLPTFDDPYLLHLRSCAVVYMWLLLGYACFVVTLSVFTINSAPLRVAEDLFLLGLTAFACYLLVLDRGFYKRGQFLVLSQGKAAKSCRSLFPTSLLAEVGCQDDVVGCYKHSEGAFRLGYEPRSWVKPVVT